jgi:hypothetical protein
MLPTKNGTVTIIPDGTPWSQDIPVVTRSKPEDKPQKDDKPAELKAFLGDRVLARNIAFMRDAWIILEAAYASAEGDVGRLYEAIKTMLFSFAGSSHKKYATYLLELLTNLEFESSPALRDALLSMSLVSLNGETFCAGDFLQEFFNRLTEAIVQHKGIEYGAAFIRQVWSRNLHNIARLKTDWLKDTSLRPHSARRPKEPKRAALNILLPFYRDAQLASRRLGRQIEIDDFDDTACGFNNLDNGFLKRWRTKTCHSRGLQQRHTGQDSEEADSVHNDNPEEGDTEVDDDEPDGQLPALTHVRLVDGELIYEPVNIDEEARALVQILDAVHAAGGDEADEDSVSDEEQ